MMMQAMGEGLAGLQGGAFVFEIHEGGGFAPMGAGSPRRPRTPGQGYAAHQTRAFRDQHGPFPPGASTVAPEDLRQALVDGFPITVVDCRSPAEVEASGAFACCVECCLLTLGYLGSCPSSNLCQLR